MNNERKFYSPSKRISPIIRKLDNKGKTEIEKLCQFEPQMGIGVYEALTSDESELGIDEKKALESLDCYGIWIYNSNDWLKYQLDTMEPGGHEILQRTISEKNNQLKKKDFEINDLMKKIEALKQIKKPGNMELVEEFELVESDESDEIDNPNDLLEPTLPVKQRGKPKGSKNKG